MMEPWFGAKSAKEGTAMSKIGWNRWLVRTASPALTIALLVGGLAPEAAETAVARDRLAGKEIQAFSNTSPLTVPDGGQVGPSAIFVSEFETELADVDVTLHNVNHGQVGDLDFLLVGPGGQTALLLSDVGSSANNVTLTLDDQAANQVSSGGPLANGSFQPTNFQSADGFFPPAPASPPSGSELGVFNSTDPNGTWSLFIRDDNFGTTGALNGGWSLRIASANGVPNAAPDSFSAKAGKTLSEPSGVLANDSDPDADSLTAILAGQPKKGKVELQADGSFTYKSSKKAKGTDSFTYLAEDPTGLKDLETVTIKIKKAKKKGKK
jgi:subtilisin-like proprotein convertase family protein